MKRTSDDDQHCTLCWCNESIYILNLYFFLPWRNSP